MPPGADRERVPAKAVAGNAPGEASRWGTEPLSDEVLGVALDAGCAVAGIAPADVLEETRVVLHERKARGLHGGMEFTYRNPDRSTDPGRIVAGARSLVVGAWDYRRDEAGCTGDDGIGGGHASVVSVTPSPHRPAGRVAEYARSDFYLALRAALTAVADYLRSRGWQAAVVCDDNALVDRAAAHRGGLGWFGKNSLVLVPGLGSRFVLGTVVTDAPLIPSRKGPPAEHGEGCGQCTRCLTACPTGALREPGVLDARRCLAWLLQAPGSFPVEHRRALGDRIYGCDECQRACPINRAVDRHRRAPPEEDGSRGAVDLLDLLEASDDELIAEFGRWYIASRDPRYLRRNALVVLGNVGDGSDPATVAALAQWIGGDDGLLAEHARWAARELGRADLIPGVT